jgi:hypothetical protein
LYKIIQFLGLTGEFLGILAGLMPVQYRLGTTIVSGLLAFASRNIGLSRLQEQQQKIWSSIQDEKDAIHSAVISHEVLIRRFEDNYPESNLTTF